MDLVLHKRLLELQAENSMLKEEIQKLQEISQEISQEKSAPADSTKDTHLVKTLRKVGDPHIFQGAQRGTSSVHQTLHQHNGEHYVVSSNPNETMIFKSDERGNWDSQDVGDGNRPTEAHANGTIHDHHMKTFDDFIKSNLQQK